MAGLTELINRDNPIRHRSNDTMRCTCIPMCTATEYMTEITEIDYDFMKEREAIGDDNFIDDKYVWKHFVCNLY